MAVNSYEIRWNILTGTKDLYEVLLLPISITVALWVRYLHHGISRPQAAVLSLQSTYLSTQLLTGKSSGSLIFAIYDTLAPLVSSRGTCRYSCC